MIKLFLSSLMIFGLANTLSYSKQNLVICTATDSHYFNHLLNLIGSIHRVNFNDLDTIIVYDLGMSKEQLKYLSMVKKLVVSDIELTHPDLLTPFVINNLGKVVPGWYAWKPVIMKQTLDQYPTILYLDSGLTVLRPLNELFSHIEQNGYFFMSVLHNIRWSCTKFVINAFNLESSERKYILADDTLSISANFIGCSKKLGDNLILPMYQLTKDLRYFADDGTTCDGFGTCRHDQTLWSIHAHLLGLEVKLPGWTNLRIDGKDVPFHSHWKPEEINSETTIYQSRWDYTMSSLHRNLGFSGGESGRPFFEKYINKK